MSILCLTHRFHLFTAIVRDLTAEYETAKLKRAEDDCLPQMIWKINTDGGAITLNNRFLDYTGISEEQTEEVNVFSESLAHPDDYSATKKAFADANADKKAFEIKRRVLGKDGEYKWMLTRASPILDDDNDITFWCGSCTDIDSSERIQVSDTHNNHVRSNLTSCLKRFLKCFGRLT
jgi:PAS domain S-box-containing protein